MKINKVFRKPKYIVLQQNALRPDEKASQNEGPAIPNGLWIKCQDCGATIYNKDLLKSNGVCTVCGRHFRLSAADRIELIMDTGTFREINDRLSTLNPLDFPGYEEKILSYQNDSGIHEAVITGYGKIYGNNTVIAVMDSKFLMGSMGSVVGEKITRAIEFAGVKKLPLIIFTASGGARMQEGIYSLMQMAKTSAAIAKFSQNGGLYISVLTDPTTGGVTASFAMLGDLILAEPGALIGFAGQRVIEQTIRQQLPEGFQKAEFLLEHGFIDKIVPRNSMKTTLSRIIRLHQ
ncbi:Acetyl-coenzyme A carboxylase carboxyl transferase subunit beta [Syntrophobotulus glycolicus DSM 8271]|uniref:Acetyl-coenzyme A carboxylase carboxyl transferase subunit beta n=1 Tax=Syntrophobotulus glycolicus (strain DSM 8271 / FlGlyR) TaxID=645991 RepID=F0T0C5_SYNGF|nr:acetyl-CoA carboxylase, carboxyltransferase subunit beta [Syntrophobotulus glycolicus]ADY57297.1 Acetyl-coenzyme A carboxylase carboxyl transferase subunit beta [Syntrophobotulus glycolicus DSM 8271]